MQNNKCYYDIFMNSHLSALSRFESSILLRCILPLYVYTRDSLEKSDCILFRLCPRIRAPSLRTVSFECCRTRAAHKSRDGPPGSAVYPVTFSTSHRTRRFESPSSRGRHRSCQVSLSSMRIPRRRGTPVPFEGRE